MSSLPALSGAKDQSLQAVLSRLIEAHDTSERLGDHPLSMRLPAETRIVAGGPIPLRFPADKLNLFDAATGRRL